MKKLIVVPFLFFFYFSFSQWKKSYEPEIVDTNNHIELRYADSVVDMTYAGFVNRYYAKGVNKIKDGDYTGAVSCFNALLSYNQDNPLVFYYRGLAFYNLLNYSNSVDNLTYCLNMDSNNYDAWFQRGMGYLKMHSVSLAIKDFMHAARIHPLESKTYYNLALAYLDLGNNSDACAQLKKAADLKHPEASKLLLKYCK